MIRVLLLLCSLVFLLVRGPAPAAAATLGGHHFPDRIVSGGERLLLNGLALKEVSIFSVDVYVVGLYLARPSRDWKEIVESTGPKVVRFRFTRNIGRSALLESWLEDLRESCDGECKPLIGKVQKLVGPKLPDIRKGQEMDYVFGDDGMSLLIEGKTMAILPGSSEARAILAALIGNKAPSPELRQALLGVRRL